MSDTYEQQLTRERNERSERQSRIESLAHDVAKHLQGDWVAMLQSDDTGPSCRVHLLERASGRKIGFTWEYYGYKGKIGVFGIFGYGDPALQLSFPYGFERPSINVSESRGAVVIAREIERRFMPVYDKAFYEIDSQVKRYTHLKRLKLEAMTRLGLLAGALQRNISDSGFRAFEDSKPSIEAKVFTNGDGTRFELAIDGLSETEAGEVISLVRSFRSVAMMGCSTPSASPIAYINASSSPVDRLRDGASK